MRKGLASLIIAVAALVAMLQLPASAPAQPSNPMPVTPPGISFARETKLPDTCRTPAVQARLDKARQDNMMVDSAIDALTNHMAKIEAQLKALRGKPEFAAEAPALMEAMVADGREYDRLIAWQNYIHAIQRYYVNLPACPGDPPVPAPPPPGIDDGPPDWPDTWSTPPALPPPLPNPRCRTAETDRELAEIEAKLATLIPLRDTMIRTYWDDVAKARAPGANPLLRQNLAREWRKVSETIEEVQALQRRADVLKQLKPCATLPVQCRTPEDEARREAAMKELDAMDKAIAAAEAKRVALVNEINQLDMMDACPCPPPRNGVYIQVPPPGAAVPPAPTPSPPPAPKANRKGAGGGGRQSSVLSGNVLQGVGVEVCPPPRTGKEDEDPDD